MTAAAGPFAPFRPRRGRAVALGFVVASVVIFGGLSLALLATGYQGWSGLDSVLLLGFGLVLAAVLWRFAAIGATPSREGLVVRNVLITRSVAWSEVDGVRFGGGDAWAWLELADGDTLAVMAVQRSDGELARVEAGRLAALVQSRGGTAPRPRPSGPDDAAGSPEPPA